MLNQVQHDTEGTERSDYAATAARALLRESQGMRTHAARRLRDQKKTLERSDYAATAARALLRESQGARTCPARRLRALKKTSDGL